jgi:predicted DCC family thiol-disulfide oxidoreductase YuxK
MNAAPRPVLIFDGVCNICSFGVQVVLRHDRDGIFDFAFAQRPVGEALKRKHGFGQSLDSMTVVAGDAMYVKSEAALYVLQHLPAPWRWLRVLRAVPRPLRDRLYDVVARNRYNWFGKRDVCLPPPPGAASRFLDKP